MPAVESNGNETPAEVQPNKSQLNLNLKINNNAAAVVGGSSSGQNQNQGQNEGQLQVPIATSFTLTRKRRVELSPVSPVVDGSPALHLGRIPLVGDVGQEKVDEKVEDCPKPPPRARHNNNPAAADLQDVLPGSNVLRKVANLTLEQMVQNKPPQKNVKSQISLEKLDLKSVDKFEGQMLLNWFISSLDEGHYLKELVVAQDLRILASQFCNLLLSAGVLKQIEDHSPTGTTTNTTTTSVAGNQDTIFRHDLMYYWSPRPSSSSGDQVKEFGPIPGKLSPTSWPPPAELVNSGPIGPILSTSARPGAKYTEAGTQFEVETQTQAKVKGQVNPDPTLDTNKNDKNGKEFQQTLMGIKREHKEVLTQKEAEFEVKVFSLRGESEELLDSYSKKIAELEAEITKLKTAVQLPVISEESEESESDLDDQAKENSNSNLPPPPPPIPAEFLSGDGNFCPPPPCPPPMPPAEGDGPSPGPPPPPPPLPGSTQPGVFTIGASNGLAGPVPPPMPSGQGGPSPCPCPAPPPPGSWTSQIAAARKKPITPKVPMKPLYWNRIQIKPPNCTSPTFSSLPPDLTPPSDCDSDTVDSILDSPENGDSSTLSRKNATMKEKSTLEEKETQLWDKIEEVRLENLDEFVDLFSRQIVEKKVVWRRSEDSTNVRHKSAKILQSKRSQNVGILMRSLNLNIDIVREAIFKFDLSIVDLETFEKLLEIRATKEEIQHLEEHVQKNPVDDPHSIPLDKPDRFLYEMNLIPLFVDRINCIASKLSNLSLVCEQLTSSVELQRVIALILTLGNYMNGGSVQRGQADGFSLEILPKLKDVKSKNNSFTFLHFIVSTYIKRFDEAAGTPNSKLPVPEPSDIEKAASLNFDDVLKDLESLKRNLQECERQTERVIFSNSCESPSDPADSGHFKEIMHKFLQQANEKTKELEDHLAECKMTFLRLIRFFAFTPKKPEDFTPKEFFSAWLSFSHDFKEIWRGEQQRILKERIKEAEAVVKEKRTAFYKNIIVKKAKVGGLREKFRRSKEKEMQKNPN